MPGNDQVRRAPNGERPGAAVFSDAQWTCLGLGMGLSGRELQIVRCIFAEQKEALIARELGISPHTVHTHLERLYRKLGVRGRCGVVLRVLAEHLGS